jgi:hypothetical protein
MRRGYRTDWRFRFRLASVDGMGPVSVLLDNHRNLQDTRISTAPCGHRWPSRHAEKCECVSTAQHCHETSAARRTAVAWTAQTQSAHTHPARTLRYAQTRRKPRTEDGACTPASTGWCPRVGWTAGTRRCRWPPRDQRVTAARTHKTRAPMMRAGTRDKLFSHDATPHGAAHDRRRRNLRTIAATLLRTTQLHTAVTFTTDRTAHTHNTRQDSRHAHDRSAPHSRQSCQVAKRRRDSADELVELKEREPAGDTSSHPPSLYGNRNRVHTRHCSA